MKKNNKSKKKRKGNKKRDARYRRYVDALGVSVAHTHTVARSYKLVKLNKARARNIGANEL